MGNLVRIPHSELNATLEKLDQFGVAPEHFTQMRSDDGFAERVAQSILRGGEGPSLEYRVARKAMGRNFFGFFGLEDWVKFFKIVFAEEKPAMINEFPWGEDVLNAPCPFVKGKRIRQTHFAFWGVSALNGVPLTVPRWHILEKYFSYLEEDCLVPFIQNDTCEMRWYLMPLHPIPGSEKKTYRQQIKMLPLEYEMPKVVEAVTLSILYHLKNRYDYCYNPYNPVRGRCTDVLVGGDCIEVGTDENGKLTVINRPGSLGYSLSGLAASRKLPKDFSEKSS